MNAEVLARVREELKKRPKIGSGVLHQMAQWIDPSLGELTTRAFQARYVFPVRYELGISERKTRRQRKPRKKRQRRAAEPKREPARTVPPVSEVPAVSEVPRVQEIPAAPEGPTAEQGPPLEKSPAGRADRRRAPHDRVDRDRVRAVFLELAQDFAAAESTADIVRVFSRLDEYVDRVVGERN